MLLRILDLILGTAADLLAAAFLARVWMQWARTGFRNPLGRFVQALTDWAVLPLRRVIPGLFGADLASVFAAWFAQIAFFGLVFGLAGAVALGPQGIFAVAWLAALAVLRTAVYLAMGVVILMALLSWLNPYSPFAPLFDALARPLLAPVRKRLPPLGGVDLSPLIVLVVLEILLAVIGGLQPAAFFGP